MRMRIGGSALLFVLATLLATATLALGDETSSSHGPRPYTTVWDDFRDGFSAALVPGTAGARWFYFSAGPYVGDDGLTTTSNQGLRVVPRGTNPTTGRPAFTRTLGQEATNGGLPGGLDHVKWLVYANNIASTGQPGFDAVPGQELSCESWVSGRTFGTAGHPFGANVRDADDDLRLSAVAINAIDFETFIVSDFFVTNERIYALYERLPFGRPSSGGTLGEYASFTFTVPVANRSIGDQHHLKIAYDRRQGTMRWLVDDREVLRVNRLGFRIDRRYMVLDHGGTETLAQPACLRHGHVHAAGRVPSGGGESRTRAPLDGPELLLRHPRRSAHGTDIRGQRERSDEPPVRPGRRVAGAPLRRLQPSFRRLTSERPGCP